MPELQELWLNAACEVAELPLMSVSLTGLNVSLFSGAQSTLRALSALTNLRWLNLSRAFSATSAELAIIVAPLQTLVSLDVSGCKRLTALGWLSSVPRLQILNISALGIGDRELRPLKSLQRLVQLRMQACDRATDAGILPLKDIKCLQLLDVRGCRVSSNLREHFPVLTLYQ
jgi:hypothetical protein